MREYYKLLELVLWVLGYLEFKGSLASPGREYTKLV